MIGALDIAFDASGSGPRWRFAPTTGPEVARVVIGRSPEEAARMLPRVFNLCAAAHAAAAAGALGLASTGAGAEEGQCEAARQERLRDHAVAVLNDWPALLGAQGDRAALRQLGGGARERLALRRHLLGGDIELAEASPAALDGWLARGDSPTARLLRLLRARLEPGWGRVELDRPRMPDIVAALDAGQPGAPRETTAADGWRTAPLIAGLVAREGASLFVRLLARLLDFAAGLAGHVEQDAPCRAPAGIGFARAARGLLAHRARVEHGVVTDYRVLAPSAWNLAPDGLLARMLAALPVGSDTPMLARIAVACVNPCVPVRLRFETPEGRGHA